MATTPNKHPQKASKSIDLYNHLSHVGPSFYQSSKNKQEASFEGKRGKAKQMSTLIKSI
jgi:hypothetical protein